MTEEAVKLRALILKVLHANYGGMKLGSLISEITKESKKMIYMSDFSSAVMGLENLHILEFGFRAVPGGELKKQSFVYFDEK